MKKALLFLLLFLCLSTLSAQEKGKFRVGVDLSTDNILHQVSGNKPFTNSIGKSYTIGVGYNITDKMNIGLKFLNQTFYFNDIIHYYFKDSHSDPYLYGLPTNIDGKALFLDYNYHFHNKKWSVSPFVELAMGIINFPKRYNYDSIHLGTSTYNWYSSTFPKYALSEIVATGLEFHHVRLSLEYLILLPKTTVNIKSGTGSMYGGSNENSDVIHEKISVDRLTFKVGFYIGGGRWKKAM